MHLIGRALWQRGGTFGGICRSVKVVRWDGVGLTFWLCWYMPSADLMYRDGI